MFKKSKSRGFTLIEVMIVIAIIGILAGIAIPNFIAYRNKSFCTRVESDANRLAGSIADYFAIPSHSFTPNLGDLNGGRGFTFSGEGATVNTGSIQGTIANNNITITVTDGSGQCPVDYQSANPLWQGDVFTKRINR